MAFLYSSRLFSILVMVTYEGSRGKLSEFIIDDFSEINKQNFSFHKHQRFYQSKHNLTLAIMYFIQSYTLLTGLVVHLTENI